MMRTKFGCQCPALFIWFNNNHDTCTSSLDPLHCSKTNRTSTLNDRDVS